MNINSKQMRASKLELARMDERSIPVLSTDGSINRRLLNRCKPSTHPNTRVSWRTIDDMNRIIWCCLHMCTLENLAAIGLLTDLWIIYKVKIAIWFIVLPLSDIQQETCDVASFQGGGNKVIKVSLKAFLSHCECVRARWPTNMCRASVWTVPPVPFVSVRPRHACQAEPQLLRHQQQNPERSSTITCLRQGFMLYVNMG